jgi:tetratricopeptide (TPR) repeat protein
LIEEYTEFLNECPQYYRAYYERAILYTHVGRYKEAIADNEILIKHNERLWYDALINKAKALYFMKEYGLALKSANRYFEVEEQTESEAYKIRAEIFKKLKMYDEYNEDMRKFKKKEKEEKKKKIVLSEMKKD